MYSNIVDMLVLIMALNAKDQRISCLFSFSWYSHCSVSVMYYSASTSNVWSLKVDEIIDSVYFQEFVLTTLVFIQHLQDFHRLSYYFNIYSIGFNAKVNHGKVRSLSLSGRDHSTYWNDALTEMNIRLYTYSPVRTHLFFLAFPSFSLDSSVSLLIWSITLGDVVSFLA